jgi:uncharacterized membrane protein
MEKIKMNKEKNKTIVKSVLVDTLKGGFGVVLPTFGMIYLIVLIYSFIIGLLNPITDILKNHLNFPEFFIDMFSMFLVFSLCFICGIILKTKLGKFAYFFYEKALKKLRIFKLFNTLQEIYKQLVTKEEKSFSEAVIAFPYGRHSCAWSGLISSRWRYKGVNYISIFFPTCPNFTSGVLKHVPEENVDVLDGIPVDKMMRTVISCGSGTKELLEEYNYTDKDKELEKAFNEKK